MNGLPEFIQFLIHFDLGALDGLLRFIDCIREQVTSSIDALGINAVLEFNALRLQEVAQAPIKLVFLDGFHNSISIVAVE